MREIVITEKIDGENCGIERGGVYARSHAAYTTSPWSSMVRQLHGRISHDLHEGIMLFGENVEGIHSIEYVDLNSPFYLFGIRENDFWSSWKEVEETAFLLSIPTAPVLFQGKVASTRELESVVKDIEISKIEFN